jgi:plastocyanin
MKKWLALLTSVLTLGLVAAGCGGDDDKGSSSGGSSSSGDSKAGSSGSSGAKAAGEVAMKEISFKPGNVTIKAGQTVKWTNDDQAGHDVTATGGADKFKSGAPGALQMGDTFAHKFTKPGTVQYVCTVHSGMKGTIKVE